MTMDANPKSTRVFLNPNFKNTHINPIFLKPQTSASIHINPMFLEKLNQSHGLPENQGKIIAKSRTKLIRQTICSRSVSVVHSPLIKIGPKKLVRASLFNEEPKKICERQKICDPQVPPAKGSYKIDRRASRGQINKPETRKHFVSKYALSRLVGDELTLKKVTVTNRRTCRLEKTLNKGGMLLNINGVLYKSTKTKLQKTLDRQQQSQSSRNQVPNKSAMGERVLFVRGNKFILDNSGHNLTRVQTEDVNRIRLKRIDIGGLTYVANSQNTFIRTDIHRARNHLSSAKQKSINLLSRRLVKSNVPCPIFRKVGKCAAYERGKCPKVHDENQVAICPRFLKGECLSEKCLLSHNVTLSKMPTCKFFLQGCCVRIECPYLHKKLNVKTEICLEFLKGFCNLAEKCNKRHEFLSSDIDCKTKSDRIRCYLKKKENLKLINTKANPSSTTAAAKSHMLEVPEAKTLNGRYFKSRKYYNNDQDLDTDVGELETLESTSNSRENEIEIILRKRPKLGELPAFIPL